MHHIARVKCVFVLTSGPGWGCGQGGIHADLDHA
jgi:hypothetical protein